MQGIWLQRELPAVQNVHQSGEVTMKGISGSWVFPSNDESSCFLRHTLHRLEMVSK